MTNRLDIVSLLRGKIPLFIAIFSLSFVLYYPSLTYYFFQDDWFVLNWVRTGDLSSFLAFRTDIIYWRPLSMPIFFKIGESLFGLNPAGFHALAFILFCSLITSIYFLFKVLLKSQKLAISASLLYATWPIHFISLSWISTTAYIIGPLFQVLSFIFFLQFIEGKNNWKLAISFIFFILALALSEMAVILPVLFLVWGLVFRKQFYLRNILVFFLVDIVYLLLRFVIFPVPAKDSYQIILNLGIVKNFLWYIVWALGIPESFKSLIFPSLPTQSIKILAQFWTITLPVLLLTLLLLKLILENVKQTKTYLFGLAWIVLGLLPIITLVNHSYPMYLSFAGLGFLYIVANALKKTKFLLIAFILLWVLVSYNTLRFTRLTHWVHNEQSVSKAYADYLKENVPNPPFGSTFVFKAADINFAKENNFVLVEGEDTLRLSLNDGVAVQVLYDDASLKSYFVTNQEKNKFEGSVIEIFPRVK